MGLEEKASGGEVQAARWLRRVAAAGVCVVLAGGWGCGAIAVRSMKPILRDSSDEILRNGDLKTVGEGLPGQILTLRGLQASRPGDGELAAMAVQLHLFYALGFVEQRDPEHAATLYAQGRDLGLDCLRRDPRIERALHQGDLVLREALKGVDRDRAPLLLWTAACWASWIGLQLHDPAAIADLPLVEAILERVVELSPDLFYGMPWVVAGTIRAMRPPALGGDPEAAREAFEKAFAASHRRFLLTHVYFATSYCRQIFDRDLFEATLREVLDAPADLLPEVRLLNLLAKERARSWIERTDEIF